MIETEPSRSAVCRIGVIALAAALAAAGAAAQVPEHFTNLQVLPEDIERLELIEVMRGFAGGLGVRCEHCHVGGPALAEIDFAADGKAQKQTARVMLRMVRAINQEHLGKLPPERPPMEVQCFTCHHGVNRPLPIGDVVAEVLAEAGAEAAAARYAELREKYYGRSAYDFGHGGLNYKGDRLTGEGKPEQALVLLELNAQYHPESGRTQQLIAEAALAAGDRDKARAALRRALELEPDNSRVKQRLQELESEVVR